MWRFHLFWFFLLLLTSSPLFAKTWIVPSDETPILSLAFDFAKDDDIIYLKNSHQEPSDFITVSNKSFTLIAEKDVIIDFTIGIINCKSVIFQNCTFQEAELLFEGEPAVEIQLLNTYFIQMKQAIDLSYCQSIVIDNCQFVDTDIIYHYDENIHGFHFKKIVTSNYIQVTHSYFNNCSIQIRDIGEGIKDEFILFSLNYFWDCSLYIGHVAIPIELFSNLFDFSDESEENWGLYRITFAHCHDVRVMHNVFNDFKGTVLVFGAETRAYVSSNIFNSPKLVEFRVAIFARKTSDGKRLVILRYNDIFLGYNQTEIERSYGDGCLDRGGNVVVNPDFRDSKKNNFMLTSGKELIGENGVYMGLYSNQELDLIKWRLVSENSTIKPKSEYVSVPSGDRIFSPQMIKALNIEDETSDSTDKGIDFLIPTFGIRDTQSSNGNNAGFYIFGIFFVILLTIGVVWASKKERREKVINRFRRNQE